MTSPPVVARLDSKDVNNRDQNNDSKIRPFEWLTSPASLMPILEPVIETLVSSTRTNLVVDNNSSNNETSTHSNGCRVLHVGSGSSVLGEYLLEHSSHAISKVVNVDKDQDTLLQMQSLSRDNNDNSNNNADKLEYVCVDLVHQRIPYPDQSFDLVLDKSTLDCALCSDRASAWLLHEVYRLLSCHGGTYVLVSFHHVHLLRPLLEDCPGMEWDVTCHVMERQVEDLVTRPGGRPKTTTPVTSNNTTRHDDEPLLCDGTDRRMVNVLVAQRRGSESQLSVEDIYQHIHQTNDQWYKKEHPILTQDRLSEIRQAFAQQHHQSSTGMLALQQCYQVLFSELEREHLTYEYFLEDWNAYVEAHEKEAEVNSRGMTIDVALSFLEEMQ